MSTVLKAVAFNLNKLLSSVTVYYEKVRNVGTDSSCFHIRAPLQFEGLIFVIEDVGALIQEVANSLLPARAIFRRTIFTFW